jgi:hypothetical protein
MRPVVGPELDHCGLDQPHMFHGTSVIPTKSEHGGPGLSVLAQVSANGFFERTSGLEGRDCDFIRLNVLLLLDRAKQPIFQL